MGYASQLLLFKVMQGSHPVYFQNKMVAKTLRDELESANLVVTRGPDHWRGESFNKAKRTRGSRSTW